MSSLQVRGLADGSGTTLRGVVSVPGDKSISHRALMLSALADGTSRIDGLLSTGDCQATLTCLRDLGVTIEPVSDGASTSLLVHGRGLRGLRPSQKSLDCGRSGTTMRLLAGVLAGQSFDSVLTGEPQLLRRPMRRVTDPLRQMGAIISDTDGHGPLSIRGHGSLRGHTHDLAVASAQVKSAILLAGLYAEGVVNVHLPGPARDHTERMLVAQVEPRQAGQRFLTYDDVSARLDPSAVSRILPLVCTVPGDFSSAAFLMAAGTCVPGAEVTVTDVGTNLTRTGFLDVLRWMGADTTLAEAHERGGEPVTDITVRGSDLKGVMVGGDVVVRMIDEFPVLAVVATQAAGTTLVRDAAELRVKESDRIASVVGELRKLGATIEPRDDGFLVEGPTMLRGAEVDSQGDHRLGMALVVAGLVAQGETIVHGAERIADSFPGFVRTMRVLGASIDECD